MANPRITHCPSCNSAFRVNAAQLATAKGYVRCGACRHVFSALENMVAAQAKKQKEKNPNAIPDTFITTITTPGKPDSSINIQDSYLDNIGVLQPDIPLAVPKNRRRYGKALWVLPCTLILFGLILQFIWFNAPVVARYSPLRPALQFFCDLTGCLIPSKIDLDAFEVQKLLVWRHPEQPETLIMDAIIYNSAEHAQPFPRIMLTFNNLQGVKVASRIFAPKDYLDGEASTMTIMPAALPVRLRLEVINPEQDAVNYHLSFIGDLLP